MTVDKNESHRDRLRRSVALTGVCAALAFGTARAETYLEPRVGFGVSWIDNVELATNGSPKHDELIGQVRPGVTFTHDGRNLQAFLDYGLQAVYFQDQDDSQVFHQGELGVQFAVLPEWLYVDLGGSRAQTVIDPRQPINTGNLFQTGNVADSTSGQITPILLHRFRAAELEASYTRGFLKYSRADTLEHVPGIPLSADDSRNESATFSLRSPDPDVRLTWDASYYHDKVDYDIAETFTYDRAYLELGLALQRGFRLIAQGGLESDPLQHRSTGGLQETSYKGGFEWREGERNLVRALVGHRFFGTTYEGVWRYTGRVLESDMSYAEGPTTQAQSQVVRGITAPGGFPPGLGEEFSRITSDVYLSKLFTGRLGLRGRVTGIFLAGSWERRQYIYLGNIEDESLEVDLLVTRRLGPRVTLEGSAAYGDTKLREGGSYTDRTYAITLRRQIGTKTELTLSGNRIERTGVVQPYTANWVLLGVEINFAGPERAAGGRGFAGGRRPSTRSNPLPTLPQR